MYTKVEMSKLREFWLQQPGSKAGKNLRVASEEKLELLSQQVQAVENKLSFSTFQGFLKKDSMV